MSKKSIKEQEKLQTFLEKELDTRADKIKLLKEEFGLAEDLNTLFGKNEKATKRQADVIGDIVDATKSVLENDRNITEENLTQVDLQKLERKLIREGVQDTGKVISKLKEKQRIQERTNRLINRQAGVFKSIGDSIENVIKSIPGVGGFLADFFGVTGLGKDMENEFRGSLQSTAKSGGSFGREAGAEFAGGFGVSLFSENRKTQRLIRLFARNIPLVAAGGFIALGLKGGIESMTVQNKLKKAIGGSAFTGIVEAFGDIDRATLGNILGIRRLGVQFGISAENSAKLLQAQTQISGLSDFQARQIQIQISRFSKLRGVIPNDVISDIASNTELFAKFSKDGGLNIGLAAVEARKLGLSLSTVENISSSLLNFQSSIESELEASLLIGRQLNFNKARELALAGDLAGVQREIVKQVGSEAELNKLNVIERKSLAQALGITVQELSKLAGGDVEFMSTDIDRNTMALNRLSTLIAASAVAGGGAGLLGGRSAAAQGIMGARILGGRKDSVARSRNLPLARLVAGSLGFLGGTTLLVGGILGLVTVGKMILDAVNKGNENTDTMARNSNNNNFRPFISAEPVSN